MIKHRMAIRFFIIPQLRHNDGQCLTSFDYTNLLFNNTYRSLYGAYYHYRSTPMQVVSNWVDVPSLGKYYKALIRERYDCRIEPMPEYR